MVDMVQLSDFIDTAAADIDPVGPAAPEPQQGNANANANANANTDAFDANFTIDPNPVPVTDLPAVAPPQADAALNEQMAISKDLMQPSLGEQLVRRVLDNAGYLQNLPHGDLGSSLSVDDVVDRSTSAEAAEYVLGENSTNVIDGSTNTGDADVAQATRDIDQSMDTMMDAYRQVSEQAMEVQVWSAHLHMTSAATSKSLQGLNTLLKNQG